ncbi:glucosamine--fructose-6-phosphate aminotransferase [Sulfuriflexus mobilis]|uniref:glucosamine--fructose-6-phosphate aminotransferase n=1 Tax=Sulfuriflexus mobilis TaxID=1811807 RepID=UPI000F84BF51|nr:glucosamine--fructose-6-phosphate aminotransferase [Sulfuriflexus mobilis]
MLTFTDPPQDWDTAALAPTLKRWLEALAPGSLPLHKGVSQAGLVDDQAITAMVLNCRDDSEGAVEAKVGVFFTEVVINCGCGDEPMPVNAYCELLISIDKVSAEATIVVVTD